MRADPEKAALRAAVQTRRRNLTHSDITVASRAIVERFVATPMYESARSIAAYAAVNGEVDPASLLEQARRDGKTTYLPVLTGDNSLRFARCAANSRYKPNRYGIPEPLNAGAVLLTADEIDIIAVPIVVFDRRGNRLGMGAGYYDRALADCATEQPLLIGLAYEFQRADEITPEPWDIPMDLIVTEKALYQTRREGQ